MKSPIRVEIGLRSLRQAIEAQLRAAVRQPAWDIPEGTSVVVATTRDLTPEECRERVEHGDVVLILAAIPSHKDCRLYRQTGALYGVMTLGDAGWIDCLLERIKNGVPRTPGEARG